MAITDWPAEDRPREKLLKHGAQFLTDAELLAIFLRTGVKGKSAVDLARELLEGFGGLRPMLLANEQTFKSHHGLGEAKFCQLQAVVEMSRRHLAERMKKGAALTSVKLTCDFLSSHLRDRQHEVFAVLLLDAQNCVKEYKELFHGTIDSSVVYPREVMKTVLESNACRVIFAHNHPSGIAEPSQADQAITRRLQRALELIDVEVLDHIIVGDGEYTSFAETGLL